jgi:hypothetical protein
MHSALPECEIKWEVKLSLCRMGGMEVRWCIQKFPDWVNNEINNNNNNNNSKHSLESNTKGYGGKTH